jgi:hypothetical protein
MMTGELNYDEIFVHPHDDQPTPFLFLTHTLFLSFTVTVTIILFNLLVGLTVSDIQGLRAGAHLSLLSGRLEEIYMMESFFYSKQFQTLIKFLRIKPSIFNRLQVGSVTNNSTPSGNGQEE